MTDGGLDKINFTSENKSKIHLSGALRQRRDFLFVQRKGVRQVMTHFILQAAVNQLQQHRSQLLVTERV